MHAYSTKDLSHLFDLPENLVRSLARAGHIHPVVENGATRYTFQDLVTLKTAGALRAARISSQKILSALNKLRDIPPPGNRLNSLRPLGASVGVRDGGTLWDAHSGQIALGLEPCSPAAPSPVVQAANPAADRAQGHFERGLTLEDDDPSAARNAYESCLAADRAHGEARINLGRMLHLAGELAQAERLYRDAATPSALLSFNLAVLMEDLNRETEAIRLYRDALAQDPQLADAHFNLARLHEKHGNSTDALRSLLAYRRLVTHG